MSLQGNSLFTWLNREVRVSCTAAARSWWGLNWLRDTSIQQVKPGSSYFKVYPAVITNLTGSVRSPLRRSISLWGTGYQRKLSFQLKPPYVMSDPAMYSKVSSLITSMMGHTTVLLQQMHTHTQTSDRLLFTTSGAHQSWQSAHLWGAAPPEPHAFKQWPMLWLHISHHSSHLCKASVCLMCVWITENE